MVILCKDPTLSRTVRRLNVQNVTPTLKCQRRPDSVFEFFILPILFIHVIHSIEHKEALNEAGRES